jgi:hypothetical protein
MSYYLQAGKKKVQEVDIGIRNLYMYCVDIKLFPGYRHD